MAGNAGHPFFGNQHVKSSEVYSGGYTYDWLTNVDVMEVNTSSTKIVSSKINNISTGSVTLQRAINVSANMPQSIKINTDDKIAIFTSLAIAAGAYLLYAYTNKRSKSKKEALQVIESDDADSSRYEGDLTK